MSTPLPPPGWYPDGSTPDALRWFDGSRWTEHVTPLAPAGAAAPVAYGAAAPGAYAAGGVGYAGGGPGAGGYVAGAGGYGAGAGAYGAGAGGYGGAAAPGGYGGGYGPAAPTTDLGPSNGLHWVLPVGRSWQSIVAGYVGLVALLAWTGAAAGTGGAVVGAVIGLLSIALGVVAIRRAATGGHGRGRAWFAVLAGALCVVLSVLVALRA